MPLEALFMVLVSISSVLIAYTRLDQRPESSKSTSLAPSSLGSLITSSIGSCLQYYLQNVWPIVTWSAKTKVTKEKCTQQHLNEFVHFLLTRNRNSTTRPNRLFFVYSSVLNSPYPYKRPTSSSQLANSIRSSSRFWRSWSTTLQKRVHTTGLPHICHTILIFALLVRISVFF